MIVNSTDIEGKTTGILPCLVSES